MAIDKAAGELNMPGLHLAMYEVPQGDVMNLITIAQMRGGWRYSDSLGPTTGSAPPACWGYLQVGTLYWATAGEVITIGVGQAFCWEDGDIVDMFTAPDEQVILCDLSGAAGLARYIITA